MTDWGFESVPGADQAPAPLVLTVSRASDYTSELSFTASDGSAVSVRLKPRYTRLLLSLVVAWHVNAGGLTTWRGLRTASAIGVDIRAMPLADGEVSAHTVKRYVCTIRGRIRRAVHGIDARLVAPDPIETCHSGGYRIGKLGLTIAWADARANGADGVHVSGQHGVHPSVHPRTRPRAHRRVPMHVHLPVHREIEASAPPSASEESSS